MYACTHTHNMHTHTLSLSHTHIHIHIHTLTHKHTHTHTYTHSYTHIQSHTSSLLQKSVNERSADLQRTWDGVYCVHKITVNNEQNSVSTTYINTYSTGPVTCIFPPSIQLPPWRDTTKPSITGPVIWAKSQYWIGSGRALSKRLIYRKERQLSTLETSVQQPCLSWFSSGEGPGNLISKLPKLVNWNMQVYTNWEKTKVTKNHYHHYSSLGRKPALNRDSLLVGAPNS